MENGAEGSYRDFSAQRRALERILEKLSREDLPGKAYLEQYFRHMHRRDLTANTLRAAETSLRGFLTFLKNQGNTDLRTVVHNDLEAFVEGLLLVAIKRIPKMAKVVLLVLEGERVVRV